VKLLQTAPLNEIAESRQNLLTMLQQGPIMLLDEQQVSGVLVSVEQWQAITKTLEAAQECLIAFQATAETT